MPAKTQSPSPFQLTPSQRTRLACWGLCVPLSPIDWAQGRAGFLEKEGSRAGSIAKKRSRLYTSALVGPHPLWRRPLASEMDSVPLLVRSCSPAPPADACPTPESTPSPSRPSCVTKHDTWLCPDGAPPALPGYARFLNHLCGHRKQQVPHCWALPGSIHSGKYSYHPPCVGAFHVCLSKLTKTQRGGFCNYPPFDVTEIETQSCK